MSIKTCFNKQIELLDEMSRNIRLQMSQKTIVYIFNFKRSAYTTVFFKILVKVSDFGHYSQTFVQVRSETARKRRKSCFELWLYSTVPKFWYSKQLCGLSLSIKCTFWCEEQKKAEKAFNFGLEVVCYLFYDCWRRRIRKHSVVGSGNRF